MRAVYLAAALLPIWLAILQPAGAVDLTGKTMVVEASAETSYVTGASYINGFNFTIYFSNDGARFVYLDKEAGVRLLKGENRGRIAMNPFTWTVTLKQGASRIDLDVVGKTADGSQIDLVYRVGLSSQGCRLTSFRKRSPYHEGKRVTIISRERSILGACTIKHGAP